MTTNRATGTIVSSDRDRYLILPDGCSGWEGRVWVPRPDCKMVGTRPGRTEHYPPVQVVEYVIGPVAVQQTEENDR